MISPSASIKLSLIAVLICTACSSRQVTIGELQGTNITEQAFSVKLNGLYPLWRIRTRGPAPEPALLTTSLSVYATNLSSHPIKLQFNESDALTLSVGGNAVMYSGSFGDFLEKSERLAGLRIYPDNRTVNLKLSFTFEHPITLLFPIGIRANTPPMGY